MTTIEAPARPTSLDRYEELLGSEVEALRALARPLERREVVMVNSTRAGGGVAELLYSIVPMLEELGLRPRWEVVAGDRAFFDVTKGMHNALHGGKFFNGDSGDTAAAFEVFKRYGEMNSGRLKLDSEFVVIHDPQPLPLIESRVDRNGHWVWRCHIDLSHPNEEVWNFLAPWTAKFDAAIFSSPAFARHLPIPQYLFHPAIDPLSEKNRPLEASYVRGVLEKYGIDPARVILTQISRFDRLKDPVGVIRAYRSVKRYFDCQLVLAGGAATDDPEGVEVLRETQEAADQDPDIHVIALPDAPLEVNALQRGSTIVIQKSLREGFGLTVTEALWKKRPVVASAVGGIPAQVIHKHTGLLSHSVEGCAYQIRYLLSHPELAARLGEQGHEHVREHFLITGNVRRYVTLFLHLTQGRS